MQTFVFVSQFIDNMLILIAFVIGAFGKFGAEPFDGGFGLPDVVESQFHLLLHGALVGQQQMLRQITDCQVFWFNYLAMCRLLQAGEKSQQSGFAGAIFAD